MSEMKHTPGPWKIGFPPPNGEQTIGTLKGLMVAVATTRVGMEEETKANARLIAAAPELLEALKLAQQILIKKCNQTLVTFTGADVDALTAIDEAIAKATGETK